MVTRKGNLQITLFLFIRRILYFLFTSSEVLNNILFSHTRYTKKKKKEKHQLLYHKLYLPTYYMIIIYSRCFFFSVFYDLRPG